MNRRNFIQTLGLVAAGSALPALNPYMLAKTLNVERDVKFFGADYLPNFEYVFPVYSSSGSVTSEALCFPYIKTSRGLLMMGARIDLFDCISRGESREQSIERFLSTSRHRLIQMLASAPSQIRTSDSISGSLMPFDGELVHFIGSY